MLLPSINAVELSRIQFAAVASYHFIFVPLTLGLSWILLAMEVAYVKTGKEIYKDMVRYWGKLFGINFAVGVLSGLTMEFQFGTNWAYYSQYVGDIFGTPLAIEGLVAFMLESTFLGLFFFGWNKLTKGQHLFSTFCLAFGSSLSALLILVANGYMQHPVGAVFDYNTMRMETTNLLALFLNPMAQIGFAHTILAGYTTGAVFVLGISGYFLLKGQDVEFAKRSFAIAAGFGLVASIMVAVIGDQNGLAVYKDQPEKLAAIEAMWKTEPAPAAFNLIAWPDQQTQSNLFALQIPRALGVLVTHSEDTQILGMNDIIKQNEVKISSGIIAYGALEKIRSGQQTPAVMAEFNAHKADLGYGMLMERVNPNVVGSTPAQIDQVAVKSIPSVWWIFWSFRVMVGLGVLMFLMFVIGTFYSRFKQVQIPRWISRWALYSIPFPFIACWAGWFITEHGRQPWTIYGVLPTDISSSSLSAVDVGASFAIFMTLYALLLAVELFLMFKFARLGPSAMHTGKYHFEKNHR